MEEREEESNKETRGRVKDERQERDERNEKEDKRSNNLEKVKQPVNRNEG